MSSCSICKCDYPSDYRFIHEHSILHHQNLERTSVKTFFHSCRACNVSGLRILPFERHLNLQSHKNSINLYIHRHKLDKDLAAKLQNLPSTAPVSATPQSLEEAATKTMNPNDQISPQLSPVCRSVSRERLPLSVMSQSLLPPNNFDQNLSAASSTTALAACRSNPPTLPQLSQGLVGLRFPLPQAPTPHSVNSSGLQDSPLVRLLQLPISTAANVSLPSIFTSNQTSNSAQVSLTVYTGSTSTSMSAAATAPPPVGVVTSEPDVVEMVGGFVDLDYDNEENAGLSNQPGHKRHAQNLPSESNAIEQRPKKPRLSTPTPSSTSSSSRECASANSGGVVSNVVLLEKVLSVAKEEDVLRKEVTTLTEEMTALDATRNALADKINGLRRKMRELRTMKKELMRMSMQDDVSEDESVVTPGHPVTPLTPLSSPIISVTGEPLALPTVKVSNSPAKTPNQSANEPKDPESPPFSPAPPESPVSVPIPEALSSPPSANPPCDTKSEAVIVSVGSVAQIYKSMNLPPPSEAGCQPLVQVKESVDELPVAPTRRRVQPPPPPPPPPLPPPPTPPPPEEEPCDISEVWDYIQNASLDELQELYAGRERVFFQDLPWLLKRFTIVKKQKTAAKEAEKFSEMPVLVSCSGREVRDLDASDDSDGLEIVEEIIPAHLLKAPPVKMETGVTQAGQANSAAAPQVEESSAPQRPPSVPMSISQPSSPAPVSPSPVQKTLMPVKRLSTTAASSSTATASNPRSLPAPSKVKIFHAHDEAVMDLTLMNKCLFTASKDRTIKKFNCATQKEQGVIRDLAYMSHCLTSFSWNNGEERLVSGGLWDKRVLIFDGKKLDVRYERVLEEHVTAVHAVHHQVYVGLYNGKVQSLDKSKKFVLHTWNMFAGKGSINCLASTILSESSEAKSARIAIFAGCSNGGLVMLEPGKGDTAVHMIDRNDGSPVVSLDADVKSVYSLSSKALCIHDFKTNTLRAKLYFTQVAQCVRVTSKFMAVAFEDGSVRVYSVQTNKVDRHHYRRYCNKMRTANICMEVDPDVEPPLITVGTRSGDVMLIHLGYCPFRCTLRNCGCFCVDKEEWTDHVVSDHMRPPTTGNSAQSQSLCCCPFPGCTATTTMIEDLQKHLRDSH